MIVPLVVFAQFAGVQLVTSASPRTAYVGQQVSYVATVRVDSLARRSLQSSPEYAPPDVRGATAYDFPPDPAAGRSEPAGDPAYQEYSYRRALFPVAPGDYTVPAATLTYAVPDEVDPYVTRTVTVRGAPRTFTVLPLPEAGRPADFRGAVGRFTVSAAAESPSATVGAPFVLVATVTGDGNVELFPRPVVQISWAAVVNGPEQARWDSAGTVVRGSKTFRWLVTPATAGARTVPALRYSYFDPVKQAYLTASAEPITVTVGTGSATAGAPAVADSASGSQDATAMTTPFPAIERQVWAHPALVLSALAALAGGVALVVALVIRSRRDEETWE